MAGTEIRSALVSTNSVTQGEAVANLWKPLFEAGVHIDFAHRTFRWDSEAKIKAQIADAEKKLADLEAIEPKTEKERLENDVKIATLKKGIYDAKEELKRVGSLLKSDLVFFELTPVEFDID